MKKWIVTAGSVLAAVIMTACVNIQYDGIAKEPLPDNEKVEMYFSREQVPAGKFTLMGKLKATAGTSWTAVEIQNRIRNFARSKGANAVLITDIKRVQDGEARPDQVKNQPSHQWIVDDSSGNAFRYFRENMMDYSKREGPEKPVYDITIDAELLRFSGKEDLKK